MLESGEAAETALEVVGAAAAEKQADEAEVDEADDDTEEEEAVAAGDVEDSFRAVCDLCVYDKEAEAEGEARGVVITSGGI